MLGFLSCSSHRDTACPVCSLSGSRAGSWRRGLFRPTSLCPFSGVCATAIVTDVNARRASHSPWMAVSKVNAQARGLADSHGAAEAMRSVNPYWQREFWAMVTRAGQQEPLEADIRMALSRAGYVDDATITAVPASSRSELEVLRDTWALAHGAGGGAYVQPVSFSFSSRPDDNPLLHGRLAHGLGPGVRRAAPDICTACIAEGATSIRD